LNLKGLKLKNNVINNFSWNNFSRIILLVHYKFDKITQEQVVYLIVNGNFRFKELERHKNETDFDYRKRIERLYKLQKESEYKSV